MGYEVVQFASLSLPVQRFELIWAQEKLQRRNTFKIKDVKQLHLEALSHVTVENWKSCVKPVEELQEKYFAKLGISDRLCQLCQFC